MVLQIAEISEGSFGMETSRLKCHSPLNVNFSASAQWHHEGTKKVGVDGDLVLLIQPQQYVL